MWTDSAPVIWLTLLECFHTNPVLHPKPARPFYLPQHLQNRPVSIRSYTLAQTAPTALPHQISLLLGSVPTALQESPCPSSGSGPISLQGPSLPSPVSLPAPLTLAPDPQRQPESPPRARPFTHTLFPSTPLRTPHAIPASPPPPWRSLRCTPPSCPRLLSACITCRGRGLRERAGERGERSRDAVT